jgi:hypothetical protein
MPFQEGIMDVVDQMLRITVCNSTRISGGTKYFSLYLIHLCRIRGYISRTTGEAGI